ncbi:MAG TPA: hypothetical protein DCM04_07910, partial [Saprospirales bacterium]|nr:hypothetical protein [Saprospirales bacterium]
ATSFNQDIGSWNVNSVTTTAEMFRSAVNFNQDIGSWDVSNIIYMNQMFDGATSFNQNISNWNVSSSITMRDMFQGASSFNQIIGDWDISKVNRTDNMFREAISFNQDVGSWDVSNVSNMNNMFNGAGLSTKTYDEILKGWATQELISNINLGAEGINYCNSENERQSIIDKFNWIIFDAGLNCTSNIENLKSENINLSPNPTNNIIYINKGQYFLDVSIYNQLGQKLMFIEKTNHVDVNQLLSGTYIIKIKNDLNEVTKKFIKY